MHCLRICDNLVTALRCDLSCPLGPRASRTLSGREQPRAQTAVGMWLGGWLPRMDTVLRPDAATAGLLLPSAWGRLESAGPLRWMGGCGADR